MAESTKRWLESTTNTLNPFSFSDVELPTLHKHLNSMASLWNDFEEDFENDDPRRISSLFDCRVNLGSCSVENYLKLYTQ